jgi:oxygen-independent coproporphyrinogen-3 oxidase
MIIRMPLTESPERNSGYATLANASINSPMKTSSKKAIDLVPVAGHYNSLYIHVPFCRNICDYCALYSVVNNDRNVRKMYLDKISAGLEENQQYISSLSSIFIGGGTPTQLTATELETFLLSIKTYSGKLSNCEFSVECNPGTVTPEKFDIMKDLGVNRLSFGAQSPTSKTRNTLGRRTSHRQLLSAIENARNSGFENINIDLIYGVPGQELDNWLEDLNSALELKLPHYSAYSLILEEGTVLADKYDHVDDEAAVEMYDAAEAVLSRADLSRYEISNYSKPGMHCHHNYDIWMGKTYLGLGPAACSFNGEQRWAQINDLNRWLDGEAAEVDFLPMNERLAEIIAFGFRTVEGWKKSDLKDLHGHDSLKLFNNIFNDLFEEELICETDESIKPTKHGLLFADTIAEAFL